MPVPSKHSKLRGVFVTKVLPWLGAVAMLAWIVGFLFAGFARFEIDCAREAPAAKPTCGIRERRLLGLYERRETVRGVHDVGYRTRDVGTAGRRVLGSTVVLYGSLGPVPVTRVASNVGEAWKARVVRDVQRFLDSSNDGTLRVDVWDRNVFGWIAAAGAAAIAASTLVWGIGALRRVLR